MSETRQVLEGCSVSGATGEGTPRDPLRRALLGSMAGLAGAAALAPMGGVSAMAAKKDDPDAGASEGEEEAFNPTESRPREFLNDEMNTGTPWKASKTGNFDLSDPFDNNLAKLKMTTNLVGERTYIPMLARMIFARENDPPVMALGVASMFTWQLQVATKEEFGDVPEGTAVSRSMYTASYLDPDTMEPVTELKNQITGKMMKVEDLRFVENFLHFPLGGTRMVGEEVFANDPAAKPRMSTIRDWGDELILYLGGLYTNPGVHQPRLTENNWTTSKAEVMDPDAALVRTEYALMGLNKAYEKDWTGFTTKDPEFFATLARGKKIHSAEDLPDIHKRVIAEKYPHRL